MLESIENFRRFTLPDFIDSISLSVEWCYRPLAQRDALACPLKRAAAGWRNSTKPAIRVFSCTRWNQPSPAKQKPRAQGRKKHGLPLLGGL